LFPVALYCMYQLMFVRKNKFSSRREFKLVNRPFEALVVGGLITKKVASAYKH